MPKLPQIPCSGTEQAQRCNASRLFGRRTKALTFVEGVMNHYQSRHSQMAPKLTSCCAVKIDPAERLLLLYCKILRATRHPATSCRIGSYSLRAQRSFDQLLRIIREWKAEEMNGRVGVEGCEPRQVPLLCQTVTKPYLVWRQPERIGVCGKRKFWQQS